MTEKVYNSYVESINKASMPEGLYWTLDAIRGETPTRLSDAELEDLTLKISGRTGMELDVYRYNNNRRKL